MVCRSCGGFPDEVTHDSNQAGGDNVHPRTAGLDRALCQGPEHRRGLFLRSMGFLFVNRYIESRDDLSATYTDEFAGELLIETERFMESISTSRINENSDTLN